MLRHQVCVLIKVKMLVEIVCCMLLVAPEIGTIGYFVTNFVPSSAVTEL